jgi:hypothetical protein
LRKRRAKIREKEKRERDSKKCQKDLINHYRIPFNLDYITIQKRAAEREKEREKKEEKLDWNEER